MIDGAAVRVSLVYFARMDDDTVSDTWLDGQSGDEIYADVTARRGGQGVDLTQARRLSENAGGAFMGDSDRDPFVKDVVKPAVQDGIGYDLVDMNDIARAGPRPPDRVAVKSSFRKFLQ